MPDPALLDPNNRLLGWSTSDLSLYGGQPTVTLGMPRAADPGGAFVSVPSVVPDAGRAADPGASAPMPDLASPALPNASSDDTSAAALMAPTPSTGAAMPSLPIPGPATPIPAVPDPIGSGSLAPLSVASPLTALGSDDGDAPPGLATIGGGTLAAPMLDLGGAVPAADGIAAPALNPAFAVPVLGLTGEAALDLVGTTAGVVATVLDDGLATTATLLDGAVSALPIADLAATVSPALDGVAVGGSLAGGVADSAAEATEALAATTDGAVDAVANLATETLDAVTGAVTAPLAQDFGGSDPVGGVATLVEMVGTDDLFEAGPISAIAPVAEGGSILDALVADEAPGPLLGIAGDDTDGLLGGDHHDDHDGGLLGGL